MVERSDMGIIVMFMLGIGVILFGYFGGIDTSQTCDGFGIISPICWGGTLINISFLILSIVVGSLLILGGIIGLFNQQALKFYVLFIAFGLVFVVNLALPDPIPFIDEIILGFLTAFFGLKTINPDGKGGPEIDIL